MSIPDLINGIFESSGSLFIMFSIVKLYHDKIVRGVSWIHASFFMLWGYWNLYYYPHLNQWFSFSGGILIVSANTFWFGQLIYYTLKEKRSSNVS